MNEETNREILKLIRKELGGNEAKVQHWLSTRNPALCHESPLQLMRSGRSGKVLNLITSGIENLQD